jgi:hypothetical protein
MSPEERATIDPSRCAVEHGPTGYHCALPPTHKGPSCYVEGMFFNASTCKHASEHGHKLPSWCSKCGVTLNAYRNGAYVPCDGLPF